jgi:hypothetical protein
MAEFQTGKKEKIASRGNQGRYCKGAADEPTARAGHDFAVRYDPQLL